MVSSGVALGVTAFVVGVVSIAGVLYTRGKIQTVEDYISARDSAGSGTLTATLIASGMGAWILLSPAEAGAAYGGISAVVGYAIGSALPMILYAVVGPRIRELIPQGHTLTEYTLARYGPVMYVYVLLVSIGYMFAFLAAEMTGITGALSLVAGVPQWQTALLIGVFVLGYTTYGGLRASIFTDTIQTLIILPLLAVSFGVAIVSLGGTNEIYNSVSNTHPELLNPGAIAGVKAGIYTAVAVLSAEMLNQAWWQRVYAAANERILQRSFLITAVAVLPMIFVAGLFGLVAQGRELIEETTDASIAFFLVVNDVFPEWVALAVVILAVLLVMSSADTLFNALSSIVTGDLGTIVSLDESTLTTIGRALTVIVAIGAIVIGAQGYSVLSLFFIADLLAAATFVPLLSGLYTPRLSGRGALVASVAGLLVGGAFFPLFAPIFSPVLSALGVSLTSGFFPSFLGAAIVSSMVTVLFVALSRYRFDLAVLDERIQRLDEPGTAAVRADGGGETE